MPASVRSARELVRETLRLHGLDSGVAQVIVSELAANAVRHARTDFTVGVTVGDVVRIEVADGEVTLEGLEPGWRPERFGEEAEAGAEPGWPKRTRLESFGLRLVDAFADRWGVDLVPTGKRVWCELDAGSLVPSRAGRSGESARR
ncbi:MAG TPA: ATP-binding protein [Acidimicrobiia bacterium]